MDRLIAIAIHLKSHFQQFLYFEFLNHKPANYTYYGDDKGSVWRHDLNQPTNKLIQMISGLNIWDMTSDKDFLYIVQYFQYVYLRFTISQ